MNKLSSLINSSFLFGFSFNWFSSLAQASGGAHGSSHEGLPYSLLIPQAVNFSVVVVLLYILTRKVVSQHFASRADQYDQLLNKAETARREAETQHRKIKERLANLESSQEDSLKKAHSEAEELKSSILRDAEKLAKRLAEEAQQTAQYEVEKAANKLRLGLLEQATAQASQTLKDQVGGADQKRLNSEFVEKIQVVSG